MHCQKYVHTWYISFMTIFNLIKHKFCKFWPIEVNEIVPIGNTNLKIAILITFQKNLCSFFTEISYRDSALKILSPYRISLMTARRTPRTGPWECNFIWWANHCKHKLWMPNEDPTKPKCYGPKYWQPVATLSTASPPIYLNWIFPILQF